MMRWHKTIVTEGTAEFPLDSRVYVYDPQDHVPKFVGWCAGYHSQTNFYFVKMKNTYGTIVVYYRACILNHAETEALRHQTLQEAAA
ncbi:hypothetical protein [Desulfosoma sp.]|uniref:hypothetical protein n=1 Tax=Desulfosoma sp. TaxID=2603217 RepID=UPI004048EDCF